MLGLPVPKEVGLELVVGSMNVVAVEAEPTEVEADLGTGSVAMLVEEPDAAGAEPMVAVAEILVPAEPKELALGVFAGVVAPMVAVVESPLMTAVPMEPEVAAFVLEAVQRLDALVAGVAALGHVPMEAEPVAERTAALESEPMWVELVFVLALEAEPMFAEFEGSK